MKPRTALALILALLLPLTLAACGDKTPEEPPDLRGEWRQIPSEDSGETADYYQTATITDDKIEIYYISGDGSRDLCWTGTFVPIPRKK